MRLPEWRRYVSASRTEDVSVTGAPVRIGLVGVGRIAREQHLPTLARDERFTLAAAVSHCGTLDAVETFPDIESMIGATSALDAVSLCSPPSGRHLLARKAIDAGLHVMLEKPPCASVGEVADLAARAHTAGVTLFTTWHSREAAGVEATRAWLAERAVRSVRVVWKEDIRTWHPGQNWILEPGGLGVFDPGINAISILTRILPRRLTLQGATLWFPSNRGAPITAELDFLHDSVAPVVAAFDFLQSGHQHWNIEVETDGGFLLLSEGGQRLQIDGVEQVAAANNEYPMLYSRFLNLIANGISDVDAVPLQHVADAFMMGRRLETAAFEF